MRHPKTVIGALTLSAVAFAGLISHEGYTDRAVIPIKGDRPTVGFGSTFRDDGTPVKMGDTITPQVAVKRAVAHLAKDETRLKDCVTGNLSQVEYDTLINFSYQYGAVATCKSSMVKHINAGEHVQACNAYLKYRFAAGHDCSLPGSRICPGVWTRQLERQKTCLGAQ